MALFEMKEIKMYTPISPSKVYQLQYKSKPLKQAPLHPDSKPAASESMARKRLESLLEEKYPEDQRLLLNSKKEGARERLLTNPEVAPKLKRNNPGSPLPRLNSDLFTKKGYFSDVGKTDVLEVKYANGQILNNEDIQESLNPFLEVVRPPRVQKRVARAQQKQMQANTKKKGLKNGLQKKADQLPAPKMVSSSPKARTNQPSPEPSDSESELMFHLEL